jgi:hypothetical protein
MKSPQLCQRRNPDGCPYTMNDPEELLTLMQHEVRLLSKLGKMPKLQKVGKGLIQIAN